MAYQVGRVAPNIIVPLMVALPFFIFARRNRGKRFVIAFFWVAVIIGISKVGQLSRMAKKRGPTQPIAGIPGAFLVQNETPRFRIQIPEGFEDCTHLKTSPSVTHLFMERQPGDKVARGLIGITALGGMLPPNTPTNRKRLVESVPRDVEFTTKNWRGLPVPTFISRPTTNGVELAVYQIRVPLKPKAIELVLSGAASESEKLSALADTLLMSLDGPSNW
jgi:hypothetical protein